MQVEECSGQWDQEVPKAWVLEELSGVSWSRGWRGACKGDRSRVTEGLGLNGM